MNILRSKPPYSQQPADKTSMTCKVSRGFSAYNSLATLKICTLLSYCAQLLTLLLFLFVPLVNAEVSIGNSSQEADWIYTARPGDSVKSIASKYLAKPERWVDLLRYNEISNVNLLPPGTPLKIPLSLLKHYPKSATLVSRRGRVWFRKAQTTAYIPALPGLKINIGDEIKTQDGFAMIKFADGSQLRVANQSIIIFNTLTHYGETGMVDTRFRLNKGKINNKVKPRKGPASRYEVSTPSAVAAVRGTTFRLKIDNNATVTEVTEGSVLISNESGQMQLRQGQGSRISSTGNLQRLTLLPPPQLSIPDTITEFPYSVTWPAVSGATSYIAELSSSNPDDLPLQVVTVESPTLWLPVLSNGGYRLTVRAVNQRNIEGVDAELEFQVALEAEPAELTKPLSNIKTNSSQPLFQWQVSNPVVRSSLEISRDQNFQELYTRTPFTNQQSAHSEIPLAAGVYYWRVVTMAGQDNFAWSDIRQITVQDKLEDAQVIAVNYFEDRAKVFWKSVQNAENYLIQLSEDEYFKRLIREDEQQATSALLRLTPGKTYWVRVKGIGNEFYASTFGKSQILKIQN